MKAFPMKVVAERMHREVPEHQDNRYVPSIVPEIFEVFS
jgi:hypothetical protein